MVSHRNQSIDDSITWQDSKNESRDTISSLSDYDYELPAELIAQEPPLERISSRLLVLDKTQENISHHIFKDLSDILQKGDLIVLNDTKVLPARLIAKRLSGASIEILLLKPESNRSTVWQAMASPLKKLKEGETLLVETNNAENFGLYKLTVAGFIFSDEGQKRVLFDFGEQEQVFKIISTCGKAPLPPYILRERNLDITAESKTNLDFDRDLERYQTVFAQNLGAVAAPTAGLHFNHELLSELQNKGVEIAYLTLHVGPGTFKPISTSVDKHIVETEEYLIPESTIRAINSALKEKRRIIAVGTTTCRALETAALNSNIEGQLEVKETRQKSNLYIKPGHNFKIVDSLITNFHLPKSSLLVLVACFAGIDNIKAAYRIAIQEKYKFYSYGDAMFIC